MSEAAEWLEEEFDKAYKAGHGRQPLDIYNYSGSRGEDVVTEHLRNQERLNAALRQSESAPEPLPRALSPRERARAALQALLKRQRGSHE